MLVSYIETIFSSKKKSTGDYYNSFHWNCENVDVNDIKVIRSEKNFMNRIVDLHQFIKQ